MNDFYLHSKEIELSAGRKVKLISRESTSKSNVRILLLHGNPGDITHWENLIDPLSGIGKVAAFDAIGFGNSPRTNPSATDVSLDQLAEDVVAVLDSLGWQDKVYLIGHSHGGGVAQLTAAKFPSRIAGIVLIGTLGTPTHPSYRLLTFPGVHHILNATKGMFGVSFLKLINHWVLRLVMRDIYFPDKVERTEVENQIKLFAENPMILVSMAQVAMGRPCDLLAESAGSIKCPVLFIQGEKDRLVPIKYPRKIHELILESGGQSGFYLMPDAGHMLIMSNAELVKNKVEEFVNNHEVQI